MAMEFIERETLVALASKLDALSDQLEVAEKAGHPAVNRRDWLSAAHAAAVLRSLVMGERKVEPVLTGFDPAAGADRTAVYEVPACH